MLLSHLLLVSQINTKCNRYIHTYKRHDVIPKVPQCINHQTQSGNFLLIQYNADNETYIEHKTMTIPQSLILVISG